MSSVEVEEVAAHHSAANAIMSDQAPDKYPLLTVLLKAKGLADKGIWTIDDVRSFFGVGKRAIYDWMKNGKLDARDLPGRNRFLSEDLEEFLRNSKRFPKGCGGNRGEK